MEKKIIEFDHLVKKVEEYMKHFLQYSDSYIDRHKYGWRRIRFFLAINNYENYQADLESEIIQFIFDDKNTRSFNDAEHLIYKSIQQLTEFVKTGKISKRIGFISKEFSFKGDIGKVMIELSDIKKMSFKTSRRHFYYMTTLRSFYEFCENRNIQKFQEIDLALILEYISQIKDRKYGNLKADIPILRQLMKYAFEQRIIQKDISSKIPVYRGINKIVLPSVYTSDEINALLETFNRNTKIGKRNYALALLATHLGMRQSDIINLRLENIDWVESKINYIQMKTQISQSLPLLSDVGNALIDYIKYARPISKERYVFLSFNEPYIPLGNTAVSHVVQRAFKKAGVDISNRRFGPHSLRHSLADRLLKAKTIYPVISEVLGHSNSNSTLVYLNIDLAAMAMCKMDVPPIPREFYEQKGGVFYV